MGVLLVPLAVMMLVGVFLALTPWAVLAGLILKGAEPEPTPAVAFAAEPVDCLSQY
jgi:hypothetical protein